jgi:hypothetical protein
MRGVLGYALRRKRRERVVLRPLLFQLLQETENS